MKSFLPFVCAVGLMAGTANAQTVVIPNPTLAGYFQSIYPTCMTGNLMDTTCSQVVNAQFLSFANWNISDFTGIQYFDNLLTLNVSNNPATTLPPLPATLTSLDAQDIPLTSLPPLPPGLTILRLKNNSMTSLPALPATLGELVCDNLDLSSLPTLPPALFFLNVQHNNLSVLPALPAALDVLITYNNPLTALPTLPAGLGHMETSMNLLTTLPDPLPAGITYLDVSNNDLVALPTTLPAGLQTFHCGYNEIDVMPPLPATLMNFSAGGNNLTAIPDLPAGVIYFYCHQNALTALPALPNGLAFLFCMGNQITELPNPLPDSLTSMNCSNNQINCFPPLPTDYAYFTLFPNPATCLPNYGAWMDAALLAYPLCVAGDPIINPSGCDQGTGIYGSVFQDNDANCTQSAGDVQLPNIHVNLYDNNNNLLEQTFTTYTGGYYFNPGAGNYEVRVDTAQVPFLDRLCPGASLSAASLSVGTPIISGLNFDLECNGQFDLGVQSVVSWGAVFPGQTHHLQVVAGDVSQWFEANCASGQAGAITVTVDGLASNVGPFGAGVVPSINGNVFTYTVADFVTWDTENAVALNFLVDQNATIGDSLCVTVEVSLLNGDIDPINNTFTHCYAIVNSYDPNMKEVTPGDVVEGFDGYFTYTVHFQNTGTAAALQVVVMDTISANLDLSTFEMSGHSHANSATLVGNVLTVNFPNINLPDSTSNPLGSMGHFQYRIKPLPNLVAGTTIENTAHIFFDFNPAIVTNTTVNTVLLGPVGVHSQQEPTTVVAVPNPASTYTDVILSLAIVGTSHLALVDVQGRVLSRTAIQSTKHRIDTEGLANGVYFIVVESAQGQPSRTKLVVRK